MKSSNKSGIMSLLQKMFRWDILVGIFGIIGAIYTVRSFYKDEPTNPIYPNDAPKENIISNTGNVTNEPFNGRKLFIKGLKNGILYDAGLDRNNNGAHYTYRYGRVIDISISYNQNDMFFYSVDESGETVVLDTDFGNIGYYDYESEAFKIAASNNQYVIGQCNVDGEELDELIIAVRTPGDNMAEDGYAADGIGLSINVFKLIYGAWKRVGVLCTTSNVLPVNAKIINNNVYIYWLRCDEKYVFNGKEFEYDSNFGNRVFKDTDFIDNKK